MSSKKQRNVGSKSPAAAVPVAVQVAMQQWHGPLPSPDQLARFNEVVPDAAERIIRMAEQEGEHARRVQASAVRGAIIAQWLGQVFALLVAGGGLVATYKLAVAGHDWVAGIVAGTAITTVVAAFLQAKQAARQ